jgi:hypothetical protein
MDEFYLRSRRDALLVAIPFLAILASGHLPVGHLLRGFEECSVNPAERHRQVCGMNEDGEPILVEPDGRPPSSNGGLTTR